MKNLSLLDLRAPGAHGQEACQNIEGKQETQGTLLKTRGGHQGLPVSDDERSRQRRPDDAHLQGALRADQCGPAPHQRHQGRWPGARGGARRVQGHRANLRAPVWRRSRLVTTFSFALGSLARAPNQPAWDSRCSYCLDTVESGGRKGSSLCLLVVTVVWLVLAWVGELLLSAEHGQVAPASAPGIGGH